MVLGTGELYMDCLMHDLRVMYADAEVSTPTRVDRSVCVALCAPSRFGRFRVSHPRVCSSRGFGWL